jgi:hypothetical protein
MLTPAQIAELLRATSFLEDFTDAHLWKLSRHVTPVELAQDDEAFHEGEPRRKLAILISGAVAIGKHGDGRTTRLVTLGPGEAVGEGLLQLYAFEPVIAFRRLRGLDMLGNACHVLRERCVTGITANAERMRSFVEYSIGIVTALVPVIGYERATEIAQAALASGRGMVDIVLERGVLSRAQLDQMLDPAAMTAPRAAC